MGKYHQQWEDLLSSLEIKENVFKKGGGDAGISRQHRLGRLFVRERIRLLLDPEEHFFEIGLWQGYEMYPEWGDVACAGVVAGIGRVCGRLCMIIANDATVKAGAFFPQSVKKVLRAQRIGFESRLPLLYLVDSSGVFLPLQDEIFPDEDDFGRIFRNNAVISACGIPQFAAVMGNCIAGGGYLPVLCDQLLMTKGSGLYLAGPALVKAAIGQDVDAESLGGSKMHSCVSGTVDFEEDDDPSCLRRLRSLVEKLPSDHQKESISSEVSQNFYENINPRGGSEYDVRDLINSFIDPDSFEEFKKDYGKSIVTAFVKIGGYHVGIVANQRQRSTNAQGEIEIGGVIYPESSEKAARFIMDCNQMRVPLIFIQDVVGFMVGRQVEEKGIIRSGAKLVNALSNSIVPKITLIVGNSYGAGNYALCGKAYDPRFILAWPNSRYAVMGGAQAASTLLSVQKKALERDGKILESQELDELYQQIKSRYQHTEEITYAASRGWVDGIIHPKDTRKYLIQCLECVSRAPLASPGEFRTGVFQV